MLNNGNQEILLMKGYKLSSSDSFLHKVFLASLFVVEPVDF